MTTLDRRQVLLATGMALAATAAPRWALGAQPQVDPTRRAVDFTGGAPRGALASALRGVPRLDLEEGTGLPVGARIEGLGRNHAWSTGMQGAAPGVIGADGSLPDGWRLQTPRGISVSIVSLSTETVDLLVRGATAQDGAVSIAFAPEEGTPATAGQPWTGSVQCQVEQPTQGVRAYEIWIDDPGGRRAAQAFTPQPDILWPTEIQHDVAVAGGLSHGVDIQLAAGADVTASIRLRRPQLEPGRQRSSFMPSQRGDGRREPDRLTISRADAPAGADAWAATVTFRPSARPSGTIREWTSADGRRLTLFLLNYLVRLEEGSGEAVSRTVSLGRVCRFGPSCVAVSVAGGVVSAQLNGGAVASAAVQFSGAVTDQLGSGERGPLGGWIAEAALYDRALDDSELQRLSAQGAATLSDAFGRVDGPLTGDAAPTGQTYGGVELGEQAAVAELQIVSGAVIARDSGAAVTAAYSGMTFDANPRAMRLVGRVAEGVGNDAWALITNPLGFDDVTDITAGSFHLVFTTTQADLGIFRDGALSYAGTPAYSTPLGSEGFHQMGVRIAGDAAILEMPDGRLLRYVSPELMAMSGPHWVMEIFRYGTGTPRCAFLAVQVEV